MALGILTACVPRNSPGGSLSILALLPPVPFHSLPFAACYLPPKGVLLPSPEGFSSPFCLTCVCVQVWRYYLLANRPESADTDFKWSDLAAKNNGELLANLGNFINRGLSFVYAKYGLLLHPTLNPKPILPACHPMRTHIRGLGQCLSPAVLRCHFFVE